MTATRNNAFARTEHSAPNTDRGAISNHTGNPDRVTFGRWEGADFIVAHSKPSRSYKTARGAERAIAAWLAS